MQTTPRTRAGRWRRSRPSTVVIFSARMLDYRRNTFHLHLLLLGTDPGSAVVCSSSAERDADAELNCQRQQKSTCVKNVFMHTSFGCNKCCFVPDRMDGHNGELVIFAQQTGGTTRDCRIPPVISGSVWDSFLVFTPPERTTISDLEVQRKLYF